MVAVSLCTRKNEAKGLKSSQTIENFPLLLFSAQAKQQSDFLLQFRYLPTHVYVTDDMAKLKER